MNRGIQNSELLAICGVSREEVTSYFSELFDFRRYRMRLLSGFCINFFSLQECSSIVQYCQYCNIDKIFRWTTFSAPTRNFGSSVRLKLFIGFIFPNRIHIKYIQICFNMSFFYQFNMFLKFQLTKY